MSDNAIAEESPVAGRLAAAGVVLGVATAFFFAVVPYTPGRMARATARLMPGTPWADLANIVPVPTSPTALAFGLAIFGTLAFLAYAWAVRVSWHAVASRRVAIVAFTGALLLGGAGVLSPPTRNTDILNYIVQGRVSAAHGENPHYRAPAEFPEDPILPFASRQYTLEPNDYLPAWSLYNVSLARLAGDDPVRALLIYRSAFLVLGMLTLGLIWAVLGRVQPEHRAAGVVLYGWNPIVVLEGQSRLDTLMACLAVGAVLLVAHRKLLLATAALTLSVLTKWITLPLLVAWGADPLWRRDWSGAAARVAVGVAAAALVYAPFTRDASIFRMHYEMLMRGGSSAPDALRMLLGAGLIGLALWVARYREPDLPLPRWGWALLLLYFVAFVSKIGFAWYVIVPAALVALVRDARIVAVSMVLGLVALGFQVRDSAFNAAFPLPDLFDLDRYSVFLLLTLVLVGGAAVVRRLGRGRAPGEPATPERAAEADPRPPADS